MARTLIFAVCLTTSLAVCTSVYAQRATGVSGALSQPFRDLNIVRQTPADALKHAAEAPYAMPAAAVDDPLYCATVVNEIASLDVALGSDLDTRVEQRTSAGSLASGAISSAIGGAIGLPYRGIIRRITGAERRDRNMQTAIQAGMVRRAFLKGLRTRDCAHRETAPQTLAASAPLQAVSAPQTIEIASAPVRAAPPTQVAIAHHAAPVQTDAALQPVSDVSPAG